MRKLKKLYKVAELAEFYGISKATAYGLIKKENLDIIRISVRGIRVPEYEVERLSEKFYQENNQEVKSRDPDDRDSLY